VLAATGSADRLEGNRRAAPVSGVMQSPSHAPRKFLQSDMWKSARRIHIIRGALYRHRAMVSIVDTNIGSHVSSLFELCLVRVEKRSRVFERKQRRVAAQRHGQFVAVIGDGHRRMRQRPDRRHANHSSVRSRLFSFFKCEP
jgi:hypothetical protein